ncbi:MAG TPA: tRNA (adenosine(37)-N6)-threonylcarbamoyltransferase complex dimerization subunit type 1 TsaB [Thermomicrobiales bacterium]|nr:tRNA (adenosine(37)-N6)-threonylcarbamoyltransferase complex dimerization subunit type 1 TsaB [Thermomicrobiales bacterium]HRA31098.1 tRNA (adenosine(37)-N6)-threonylcarbamoyltransferase complex dimerization subunit type 1 TsaB [Thermomicrobiales bacterium]
MAQGDARGNWLLGIETSSDVASIALVPTASGVGHGAELSWPAPRNQTATLLAQVDHVLRACNLEPEALGGIVVATGPGGFNALRVGMSVAKGFAFALDLPIFGVGTLDIAAQAFAHWGLPVRAFVPAGRRRAVFADYLQLGQALRLSGEMGNRPIPALAADLMSPTVLTGDLTIEEQDALREQPNVVLPSAGLRQRRASFMVDLALPRWQAGEPDDLTQLEPIYVHQQTGATGTLAHHADTGTRE